MELLKPIKILDKKGSQSCFPGSPTMFRSVKTLVVEEKFKIVRKLIDPNDELEKHIKNIEKKSLKIRK